MSEKLLNDEVNFMITNASKKELFDYIVGLKIQSKKYKEVIDKAKSKLTAMFANGDDNKILDDLLELGEILEVE